MSAAEEDVLERLREALDALAEEETAALVQEARIEARARVRSLLAEALAERMIARAEAELAGDAPPPPAKARTPRRPARSRRASTPPPPRDRSESGEPPAPAPAAKRPRAAGGGLAWYVYGVVEEGFRVPEMLGVDEEHALEVVPGPGLAALASRVALSEFGEAPLQERIEDLAWLERRARRHEQVLEGVREQGSTVVPMRLFTIYESENSVRAMLAREQVFLAQALRRLDGRTEWGVKLFAGAEAASAAEEPGAAQEPEAGPGESYLRRRRAADRRSEAVSRGLHERGERAHARLASVAVEARVNPLQPPELSEHEGTMLINGVYLVDNDAVDAFAAEVRTLQDEYGPDGVEVVLTGPWPPYNFVNSSQEAEV